MRKYPALHVIATALKVLTVVVGLAGFIMSIKAAHISGEMFEDAGVFGFFTVFIPTVISCFVLYAAAELIYLLMDIEENTRNTASSIRQQMGPASLLPTKVASQTGNTGYAATTAAAKEKEETEG